MIKSHHREKLIDAAVFFATNTNYCGKIKLIKLLYLLDFEHFRQTGHSVTGLEYHALKMGPVPMELFQEWDALQADLAEAISIEPVKVIDYTREEVKPKRPFDDSHFSPRELRIMHELAGKFRDEYSRPLINFTHAELGPWEKVWEGGKGNMQRIPYSLAVPDDDKFRDAVFEAAEEYRGLIAACSSVKQ